MTATLPYVVLEVLLKKGVTPESAARACEYFLIPDFEKLKSAMVWGKAAKQPFNSSSISRGTLKMSGGNDDFRTSILQ